jgi:glyoxylase-like metal-dependent hydrolase (beta-lactamase superfamily II)
VTTTPEFKTTMEFAYGVPRELEPGVVRIVANNPGPFTFKGTNTYIIGGGSSVAVVDPGPAGESAHLKAILAAVGRRRVSHILLTHTHHDHVGLLDELKAATGAPACGYGRLRRAGAAARPKPSGAEDSDSTFSPDIRLADGDRLEGEGWTLEAMHTPGHAPDHLCLALAGTGILFSGDHVMAWNTSVVAPPEGDMAHYMASLERLIERPFATYFPGHGGRLDEPVRMTRAYLTHRRMREQAILDAVRDGTGTITRIVERVYPSIDARLVRAASLSVEAHVLHLISKGLVRCDGPLTWDRHLAAA